MKAGRLRDLATLLAAHLFLAGLTALYLRLVPVANPATVSLSFLLVVLVAATRSALWVAVLTALSATTSFNFFFLPPTGTFTIADPDNWVALGVFLIVAVVASNLSWSARARALEAIERRDEMTRLFDLSRDILLTTESSAALPLLPTHIARRFGFSTLAILLPREGRWERLEGGMRLTDLSEPELGRFFEAAGGSGGPFEFDARSRTYGGHHEHRGGDGIVERVVPLRFGPRPIGLLSAAGPALEPGTLDAVAGVAAIAIERAQLLAERKEAELAQQRAELASALLASFSHDLKTPLTAIQVAVSNMGDEGLAEDVRKEQRQVALREVHRLGRLFQAILDMARVDAGISPEREWVSPAEIVDAGLASVAPSLAEHELSVECDSEHEVELDPRLTSAALGHVLENAARYSPAGSVIRVRADLDDEGFVVSVSDEGLGLAPSDLDRLFERFYRGSVRTDATSGMGLGLSITRGLLAAQGGRIWAENVEPHGARFTCVVPARRRGAVVPSEVS